MSAPISRPRVRAGCTVGEGRSHPSKSGVRGAAMAKKSERNLEKKENKEKAKWRQKEKVKRF